MQMLAVAANATPAGSGQSGSSAIMALVFGTPMAVSKLNSLPSAQLALVATVVLTRTLIALLGRHLDIAQARTTSICGNFVKPLVGIVVLRPSSCMPSLSSTIPTSILTTYMWLIVTTCHVHYPHVALHPL